MNRKRFLFMCFTMVLCQCWEIKVAFSREPGFSMVAPSVKKPPEIDGRLDDAAWKQAARAALMWTIKDEKVYEGIQSQAMVAYDETSLYVAFFNRIFDKVSEDDRVEFIVDTGDMGKGSYFRISVSAGNTTFLLWKPSDALSTKIQRGEILPELIPIALAYHKEREWKPQSLQTATHIDRQAWTVEIKINFEDLLQLGAPAGQIWGGNFMRYDVKPGSAAMTWSKTSGALYDPEKFGNLIFSKGDK